MRSARNTDASNGRLSHRRNGILNALDAVKARRLVAQVSDDTDEDRLGLREFDLVIGDGVIRAAAGQLSATTLLQVIGAGLVRMAVGVTVRHSL